MKPDTIQLNLTRHETENLINKRKFWFRPLKKEIIRSKKIFNEIFTKR